MEMVQVKLFVISESFRKALKALSYLIDRFNALYSVTAKIPSYVMSLG